jgi:glycosyltransferase involved in cell wall biosynthesis
MARIAIGIEDVNRRGGQERVICELLWQLAGRHEIDLICYRAEDIPEQVRVLRVRDPGRSSLFLRALWFIPASWWRARGGRYDAVLSQGTNMWSPSHVLAHTCHAQRSRNRREVQWREHPPGWRRRLEYAIRDRILYALERRLARQRRGRIIAVGIGPKRNLMHFHGLADEDIVVADNGVDHAKFHPGLREEWRGAIRAELGLSDETFVPLFVGGRWEEKGLSLLLQALPHVQHADTRLVVVGGDNAEEWGRRAESVGARERVIFAGRTPNPERYYATADCFAFLSETEGLALVSLEAAACGLPLILAEGQAPPELLEDGANGFAVPPDPTIVAAKLDALAADPDLRRRAGEETYRRSLHYSWERQAREIEAFVLGSSKKNASDTSSDG